MKHSFTYEEIQEAATHAVNYGSCGDSHLGYLEDLLDALPEPDVPGHCEVCAFDEQPATEDWKECGFNDFRPTDKRVKAVFIGGSILEGTPDRSNSEHVFLVDGPVIHSYDEATFYRIPAPIVAPDPAEHLVILVTESVNTEYNPPLPMIWDGGVHYESHKATLHISTITDWTPAKVIADVG